MSTEKTALNWIGANEPVLTGLSDTIWSYTEPSLREWRSASATADLLRSYGFAIEWGTAGFPAAFVATRGGRGPVLGFNVEYDALPGLSQRAGVPYHDPISYAGDPLYGPAYGPGHSCGHNALAAASAGAAIAHQGLLAAARYLAATAVALVEQPETLAAIRDEFDAREPWHSLLPADATPPRYPPPPEFLKETGQEFTLPALPFPVSAEPLGKI
ncbi:hypothetical protein [Streptosporangium sp. NPDC002607]